MNLRPRATAWPRVFPALLEVIMACPSSRAGSAQWPGMRAVVPDLIDGLGSCLPVEKEETGTRGLRHLHGGIEERVPDIQSASGSRRFLSQRCFVTVASPSAKVIGTISRQNWLRIKPFAIRCHWMEYPSLGSVLRGPAISVTLILPTRSRLYCGCTSYCVVA